MHTKLAAGSRGDNQTTHPLSLKPHTLSPLCARRFVPDLEDIVQFEELVAGPPDRPPDQPSQLPDEAMAAARYAGHVTVM